MSKESNMVRRNVPGRDPEVLRVVLVPVGAGMENVVLMNDGVVTVREDDESVAVVQMLQTRSAFRGMVCAMTGLGLYRLGGSEGAYYETADEAEEGGEV